MDIKLVSGLLLIHFMALISPGPDLILTLRNAVNYGMKSGILSSLGFGTGIFFHSLLALIIIQGFGQFPEDKLPLLGLPGSAFLIYLGINAWPKKSSAVQEMDLSQKNSIGPYLQGFFTNLLNPKASIFTIGLITTQVRPDTSLITQLSLVLGIVILTISWFSFVTLVLSRPSMRDFYFKQSRVINYLFSISFIIFGLMLIKDALGLLSNNLS
ncbi:MAG: LysE family transporter [Bacteriovoracaceae bacterium]